MYGALLLPAICSQFLFSMSMMKTVLMCGCETGVVPAAAQAPRQASSRVDPNAAMTRRENFMTPPWSGYRCHCGAVMCCRRLRKLGSFGPERRGGSFRADFAPAASAPQAQCARIYRRTTHGE